MLYRKFNKKKDYRFIEAEAYRKQSKASPDEYSIFKLSEHAALNVDFCSATDSASLADIQYFRSRQYYSSAASTIEQEVITVDTRPEKQVPPDFSFEPHASRSNIFDINNIHHFTPETLNASETSEITQRFSRPLLCLVPSDIIDAPRLGVFSDSKVYSAFIKSELAKFEVDILHFNHPVSFTPEKYVHFDSIDAWIVFLSDDSTEDFLDQFIDRYIDKPTLFLVPKSGRKTSALSIKEFVSDLKSEIVTP